MIACRGAGHRPAEPGPGRCGDPVREEGQGHGGQAELGAQGAAQRSLQGRQGHRQGQSDWIYYYYCLIEVKLYMKTTRICARARCVVHYVLI